MKQLFILLLAICSYTLTIAQETWAVDNAHSNLRFEVGWEDFSVRTGEFTKFDGFLTTESLDDLSGAEIEFIVDVSSVTVIAERLAERILSDKFLNVDVYPEITFNSTSVTSTSDSTYVSTGILKICGVEKEQEVTIEVKGFKETKKGKIFGIEVNLIVDKMDYDLTWGSPRLGDKIKIVGHLLYKIAE